MCIPPGAGVGHQARSLGRGTPRERSSCYIATNYAQEVFRGSSACVETGSASHDRCLMPGPVLVPEKAFVQLAGRRAGEFVHEINGPRALEVRQLIPAERNKFLSKLRTSQ